MASTPFNASRRLLNGLFPRTICPSFKTPNSPNFLRVHRHERSPVLSANNFHYRCFHATTRVSCKEFSIKNENKKGSTPRNSVGWWFCMACGTAVGYTGMQYLKKDRKEKIDQPSENPTNFVLPWSKLGKQITGNFAVECSPNNQQKKLRNPLKLLKNPPTDRLELIQHNFKWDHTIEGTGIPKSNRIEEIYDAALNRSHADWDDAINKILGKKHGEKKVHHVILDDIDNIVKDLKTSTWMLSEDHQDYIWLYKNYVFATFIFDETTDDYRIYIYKGYCIVKGVKDAKGELSIPAEIKFISDIREPVQAGRNDSYVKEVIENFDADFLRWQECAYFRY